jgi:hypothetical protein
MHLPLQFRFWQSSLILDLKLFDLKGHELHTICPLGPVKTILWFWTILRFILQTLHFHEENNKVGPARSRFDGYLAVRSWLRRLYVLLNLRLLGGGPQWSWPNCGIIFWRSCGSHHVIHDYRVEQCEATGAQALQILSWHRYLFLTPFGSSMCGVSGGLVPHMIL